MELRRQLDRVTKKIRLRCVEKCGVLMEVANAPVAVGAEQRSDCSGLMAVVHREMPLFGVPAIVGGASANRTAVPLSFDHGVVLWPRDPVTGKPVVADGDVVAAFNSPRLIVGADASTAVVTAALQVSGPLAEVFQRLHTLALRAELFVGRWSRALRAMVEVGLDVSNRYSASAPVAFSGATNAAAHLSLSKVSRTARRITSAKVVRQIVASASRSARSASLSLTRIDDVRSSIFEIYRRYPCDVKGIFAGSTQGGI